MNTKKPAAKGAGISRPGKRRGRKASPTIKSGPVTWGAYRRFLVYTAALNVKRRYQQLKRAGKPTNMQQEIRRAVDECSDHLGPNNDFLVTFAAVERQVYPRKVDRKKKA